MPPSNDDEKARRKAEYLKRKEERQKAKEKEAVNTTSKIKAPGQTVEKVPNTSAKESDASLLLGLPEDALKQVLCCLPAPDLGRVTMTCTQLNKSLHDVREAFVLSRLRSAPVAALKTIEMVGSIDEARYFNQFATSNLMVLALSYVGFIASQVNH
jgi:F-box domain